MKRTLKPGVILLLLVLAGIGTPSVRASSRSLAAYFPAARQYPAGFDVQPIRTYTDPGSVFADMNARLARQTGFILGSANVAFQHKTVVTLDIGRFRDASGASRFRAGFQTSVLHNRLRFARLIRGIGTRGAEYVSGSCATCGATAPTLGQLYFTRGPIFAVIGIQKADLHLARQLSAAIDAKVTHAHVR